MKVSHYLMFLLCCASSYGQAFSNLTQGEVNFVCNLIQSVSSPERDPAIAKANLTGIMSLYGLNTGEATLLESAGRELSIAVQRSKRAAGVDKDVRSVELEQSTRDIATQFIDHIRTARSIHLRASAALLKIATIEEKVK